MKHALLSGKSLTFIAPMGGVQAGHAYQAGSILLIATKDAAADRPFIGAITGVHRIAKPTDEAWTQGDALYWDESAENFTTDDDGGNNLEVGVAADDVAMSAAMGNVRLHGLMVAPGTGGPSTSAIQMSDWVLVTTGEIRTLNSSPVTLVEPQGEDQIILPVTAIFAHPQNSEDFSDVLACRIYWAGSLIDPLTISPDYTSLTAEARATNFSDVYGGGVPIWDSGGNYGVNAALILDSLADVTGGDGVLYVRVSYYVIDASEVGLA